MNKVGTSVTKIGLCNSLCNKVLHSHYQFIQHCVHQPDKAQEPHFNPTLSPLPRIAVLPPKPRHMAHTMLDLPVPLAPTIILRLDPG